MVTAEQLKQYQIAYARGAPLIDDATYDALLEEYLEQHGESARPFNRQKQSNDVNDIVGTLTKVYGVTKPMRPGQKVFADWEQSNRLTSDTIVLQPKFDGCSIAVDFTTGRFYTRGDYDDGESVDVTDVFKSHMNRIKEYAIPGTTAMKFEAILSQEVFDGEQIRFRYKRPRDFVGATITSRNEAGAKLITLVPLRGYIEGKQYIPDLLLHGLSLFCGPPEYSMIEDFIRHRLEDGAKVQLFGHSFAIDGVVASVVEESRTGVCFVNPNQEVAIKILNNVKETKLIKVDYQFGKQGRITPVAILEPVMFDNVKVDHATLSTLDRVVDMGLKVNDTVRIVYNIVPYFLESLHDGSYPVPVPKDCPICGAPLDYQTLKQVRCSNPDCKGLKLGAIVRYAEQMKMMGVSEKTISNLWDFGLIRSISDLYKLTPDMIDGHIGYGRKSANMICDSIKRASTDVPAERWLGALPINDTSKLTWECIVPRMNVIESLKNGTFIEDLINVGYIPKVGEVKLRKIVDGVLRHQQEIKEIIPYIKFQTRELSRDIKARVAMTGTRDAELTKLLEDRGYYVGPFTQQTDLLIVPDYSFSSAKTNEAKRRGIPIYNLMDAELELL